MTTNMLHVAARRIALSSPYGFFTTNPGEIQTRMVQHLDINETCDITFSTGPDTRKAHAIRTEPAVAYAVHDPDTWAAAAIYGTASIDHDDDRREQLWCEALAPFFPDGPTADSFTLIHIEALRIEAWSVPDGLAPLPFGLSSMHTTKSNNSWSEPAGTYPG